MVRSFGLILAYALWSFWGTGCATGPVQTFAPDIAGDAATAGEIAVELGPSTDVACYDAIRQAADQLGPGNTVGLITIEAIKRAITSNPSSPCLPIFLDLYASIARATGTIRGL